MTPLIQCENVSFAYGRRLAVGGLCFAVEPGDYLCVVGENGSGKSTLIKGLLGLHPATQGTIDYGSGLTARGIGYLPQQSPTQRAFPAGVWEIVLSGRLGKRGLKPFYTAEDKSAAREHLARLDIANLEKRSYQELSGGQQQRVLLARALCAADSLLLLDEPVSGLDPAAAADMYALIRRINQESGVAVVMVSHDLPAVLQDAKHVLHLRGRQIFFGTAAGYKDFRGGFWGEGYHV